MWSSSDALQVIERWWGRSVDHLQQTVGESEWEGRASLLETSFRGEEHLVDGVDIPLGQAELEDFPEQLMDVAAEIDSLDFRLVGHVGGGVL